MNETTDTYMLQCNENTYYMKNVVVLPLVSQGVTSRAGSQPGEEYS